MAMMSPEEIFAELVTNVEDTREGDLKRRRKRARTWRPEVNEEDYAATVEENRKAAFPGRQHLTKKQKALLKEIEEETRASIKSTGKVSPLTEDQQARIDEILSGAVEEDPPEKASRGPLTSQEKKRLEAFHRSHRLTSHAPPVRSKSPTPDNSRVDWDKARLGNPLESDQSSENRNLLRKLEPNANLVEEVRLELVDRYGEDGAKKYFNAFLKENRALAKDWGRFRSLRKSNIKARENIRGMHEKGYDFGSWDNDIGDAVKSGKMSHLDGLMAHLARNGEEPAVLQEMSRISKHGERGDNKSLPAHIDLGSEADYWTNDRLGPTYSENNAHLFPGGDNVPQDFPKSTFKQSPFLPEDHPSNMDRRIPTEADIQKAQIEGFSKSRSEFPEENEGGRRNFKDMLFGSPSVETGRRLRQEQMKSPLTERENADLASALGSSREKTEKRERDFLVELEKVAAEIESGQRVASLDDVKLFNEARQKSIEDLGKTGFSSASASKIALAAGRGADLAEESYLKGFHSEVSERAEKLGKKAPSYEEFEPGAKAWLQGDLPEDKFDRWRTPVSEFPGISPSKSRSSRAVNMANKLRASFPDGDQAERIDKMLSGDNASPARKSGGGFSPKGLAKSGTEALRKLDDVRAIKAAGKGLHALYDVGLSGWAPFGVVGALTAKPEGRGYFTSGQGQDKGLLNRVYEFAETPIRWAYEDGRSVMGHLPGGTAHGAVERRHNRYERDLDELGLKNASPEERDAILQEFKANEEAILNHPANTGLVGHGEAHWNAAKSFTDIFRSPQKLQDRYYDKDLSPKSGGRQPTEKEIEDFLALEKRRGEIENKARGFAKQGGRSLNPWEDHWDQSQGPKKYWWDDSQFDQNTLAGRMGTGKYDELGGGSDRGRQWDPEKDSMGMAMLLSGRMLDKHGRPERSLTEETERGRESTTSLNLKKYKAEADRKEKSDAYKEFRSKDYANFKDWGSGKAPTFSEKISKNLGDFISKVENEKMQSRASRKSKELSFRSRTDKDWKNWRGSDFGKITSKEGQVALRGLLTSEQVEKDLEKLRFDFEKGFGFRGTQKERDDRWEKSPTFKRFTKGTSQMRSMIVPGFGAKEFNQQQATKARQKADAKETFKKRSSLRKQKTSAGISALNKIYEKGGRKRRLGDGSING